MLAILLVFLILFGGLWVRRAIEKQANRDRVAPYREPLVPPDFWQSCTAPPEKLVVWIARHYLPDYRTGAVTMAHEMNRFLMKAAGWRAAVIVPHSTVASYEDVLIVRFDQEALVKALIRKAHCIVTQYQVIETAAQTAANAKKPLVLVSHDDSMNPWIEKAKAICPGNVALINNSEWLDTLYRFQGVPSIVLYPPVYPRAYQTYTTRTYVTLVNCNKNKGAATFYEIAKRMPAVQFLAVQGSYGDQMAPPRLPNLRGLKNQADMRVVYAQTGILCVPSEKESWGRVAIEAAASGIPVIAHPAAGLKEALGPAGIFCDREDVDAWVTEIQRLLDSPLAYEKASRAVGRRAAALEPTQQLEEMRAFLEARTYQGVLT